jgi:curli production assembly/transport component CsgF
MSLMSGGNEDMSWTGFGIVCVVGLVGFLTPAFATEQVYHPASPTFGGNPNNGTFLLSTAQAQGEGVKSGNQGPDLTPLANALNGSTNNNGGTVPGPTTQTRGRTLANPLGNAQSAGTTMP